MYINTPKDLGQLIAKGRKNLGWNQSKLASHLGIYQPEVSKLEADPSKVDLIIIMKALALIGADLVVKPRNTNEINDGNDELGF
ncbi:helix-turn-helix domain-containing protein [Pseudocolwellia sp. AS88]|uniref:helix-turn-helix domain-containing protein n=1 Tax=Pseudocolwellia sp. AS88 TaxID=3063958 RepID=UPI0026F1E901|nr:helix-turn-helix domain-containing protein [Pseudocolwellia sp. AS88]MDO7085531.1 XRE family transcriptional regulator [Pseudocolwellia sp. AS88]